jgi:hypothetical protein
VFEFISVDDFDSADLAAGATSNADGARTPAR